MSYPAISLIITTYNRPDSLCLVLLALNEQQTAPRFEVIVADDGSTDETVEKLQQLRPKLRYNLSHCWQDDQGFRAARARNRGLAQARGAYIIFMDGDVVPRPSFLAQHYKLAAKNSFVTGNRILCNLELTEQILKNTWPIWAWSHRDWRQLAQKKQINRYLPLLSLPLGCLRYWRKNRNWQGAMSCNFAAWRSDLFKVNGFDAQFQGWGHEDADLCLRLQYAGVKRKEGRYAVAVIHLWHADNPRDHSEQNRRQLDHWLAAPYYRAKKGLDMCGIHIDKLYRITGE